MHSPRRAERDSGSAISVGGAMADRFRRNDDQYRATHGTDDTLASGALLPVIPCAPGAPARRPGAGAGGNQLCIGGGRGCGDGLPFLHASVQGQGQHLGGFEQCLLQGVPLGEGLVEIDELDHKAAVGLRGRGYGVADIHGGRLDQERWRVKRS